MAEDKFATVREIYERPRNQGKRIAELEAENARLRIAFHDATRRPLGVTPDSGAEFYDARMAAEAEERRVEMARKDQERRSDETWHYLM